MASRKFENRFRGSSAAKLRQIIRDSVSGARCGAANAERVCALAGRLGLTALGRETLQLVANDYRDARPGRIRTCDCKLCYDYNLQLLGANR